MSTLFLTLMIAFVLVILAIAALSIGWLISGRSRIVRGSCGIDPTKPKNKECGTSKTTCGLCEHSENEQNITEKKNSKD